MLPPSALQRPFIAYRIGELEDAFEERAGDAEFLRLLLEELKHRNSTRAAKLADRVSLHARSSSASRARNSEPPSPLPPTPPSRDAIRPEAPRPILAPPPPRPGTPEATLDAWVALEVLSPQSYRRPEDLAGGDIHLVARLDRSVLPWEGQGERSRKNQRLYYQIVLGNLRLEETVRRILDIYADARVERPGVRGFAAIATIMVDQRGRLTEGAAAGLSSFAWGVPHALAGNLGVLSGWPSAEASLIQKLEERLQRHDGQGNVLPVNREAMVEAHAWLVRALGLPEDLVELPSFAIRSYQYFKFPEPPDPLLLNSFFLGDLARARESFGARRATPNLRRYLGVEPPMDRCNLLDDVGALEAALAPALTPPARWPSKGRHSLVLLQQAAVNSAAGIKADGILAVNGPPGTGKTTLLRDLVAAVVAARAEVMAGFDDPQQAFIHSGEKLKAGQAWLHLYRLDPRLRGFEILVASSNNKAVENISVELPGVDALAQDAQLDYFSTLSDALHNPKKTWGLIAAVLGNAANRSRFRQLFWWDQDVGMSTYLAAAAGTPQFIQETDPATGETLTRQPRIVVDENPPANHEEALARWRKARENFNKCLKRSRGCLAELELVRQAVLESSEASVTEAAAARAIEAAREALAEAESECKRTSDVVSHAESAYAQAKHVLDEHDKGRPGILARLSGSASASEWRMRHDALSRTERAARSFREEAVRRRAAGVAAIHAKAENLRNAERVFEALRHEHAAMRVRLDAARAELGLQLGDAAFYRRPHAELHTATPWLEESVQRARDDVFVAAMRLHKAFVDAAAKPLRHNLGNLMNVFSGKAMPDRAKTDLIPDLWASLFIVVPLLSTTFASVERMLKAVPPESLGWLLIDEAGQALPQAAVGAFFRTCRAVVVGDPLQIEPVVVLPETLTQTICRQFGADPDRFNAPDASVQSLADAATPFMAEFAGREGSREVGLPLLVHRRCDEPMFGISNAIAYSNLMVPAKTPAGSRIRDVLGPSAWIDVRGGGIDKWSPEEGREALRLLSQLVAERVGFENRQGPDIYLVTPFVVVAENLRRLVIEAGLAETWGGNSREWSRERIGTVHTVQGREAEAVVLVLGAGAPNQSGARNWAGARPNLLNVAVTRAKECLYVIGNRELWRTAKVFQALHERMPTDSP